MGLATFASEVAAMVVALSPTRRFTHDRVQDRDRLDAGETAYQMRVEGRGEDGTDSNVVKLVAQVEVEIHHRLATWTAERTYTEGAMLTDHEALASKSAWRSACASVDHFLEHPELDRPSERDGDRISYIYKALVRLNP